MNGRVTTVEHLYERQGHKVVVAPGGGSREVPAGERPEPTEEILMLAGEPSFQVRLSRPVVGDDDVPDEVGFALRRASQRLYQVMADGGEEPDQPGAVEWITGPAVHEGVIAVYLDTDGEGFSRAMIDTMVGIFVEELGVLELDAEIGVAPPLLGEVGPAWTSSAERRDQS